MVRGLIASALALSLSFAGNAFAQPAPQGESAPAESVDDVVARALVDRGMQLFKAGDYPNAKRLFIEALVASPAGNSGATARLMIRRTNQKLGIKNPDDGAPTVILRPVPAPAGPAAPPRAPAPAPRAGVEDPIDPYAAKPSAPAKGAPRRGADDPIDPYASVVGKAVRPRAPQRGSRRGDEPIDPYAGGAAKLPKAPAPAPSRSGEEPVDPYGPARSGEEPVDPYGPAPAAPATAPPPASPSPSPSMEEPVDPYAGASGEGNGEPATAPSGDDTIGELLADPDAGRAGEPAAPAAVAPELDSTTDGRRTAHRELVGASAVQGIVTGVALGGGEGADAVLYGLLGGAIGGAGTHFLTRHRDISLPAARTFDSARSWGAVEGAFIAHVAVGESTSSGDVMAGAAVGGLLGAGAGLALARRYPLGTDDLAMVHSTGLGGTAAALLLGVAMSPPRDEAYSLNAALGSAAGLGAGLWLARRYDVSSSRMLRIDLVASAGAAVPWVLFYPLAQDSTGNDDEQAAALLSVAGLGAGVLVGRWLTRPKHHAGPAELTAPTSDDDGGGDLAGLVRRGGRGGWSLGAALPRPMENPTLAPPTGAFNLGVDVVAGRF